VKLPAPKKAKVEEMSTIDRKQAFAEEAAAAFREEAYPQTIGECIDLALAIRTDRLEAEKEVAKKTAREEALKRYILDTFGEDKLEGADGAYAHASIGHDIQVQVIDWPSYYGYIKENDAWDLLERRPGKVAYRARLDAGDEVPGAVHVDVVKLNLSKRGGSRRK
jgi:hypothetical protein